MYCILCVLFRTPEIVVNCQDLPDGGHPSCKPPSSLLINRQMSVDSAPVYSPEYCPDSYYNPKIGKSYAMPKFKSTTKRLHSLPIHLNGQNFSGQVFVPVTNNPLENFAQCKSSIPTKESEL